MWQLLEDNPNDKSMLKAAIDIGTNTTHLLIAEVKDDKLNVIYKKRFYCYLADQGIDRISTEAENRLREALTHFSSKINEYQVATVSVVATEAMRVATNGQDILTSIKDQFGWTPRIIQGVEEGSLIARGVMLALDDLTKSYLIVDIGGGSVEFIFIKRGKVIWIKSIPVGIANLYNQFQLSDPISISEITRLDEYLDEELSFLDKLKGEILEIVGSAGTFQVLTQHLQLDRVIETVQYTYIHHLWQEIVVLNEKDRACHPDIPVERARYIVVALYLIKFVMQRLQQEKILVCQYSLKEGLILS